MEIEGVKKIKFRGFRTRKTEAASPRRGEAFSLRTKHGRSIALISTTGLFIVATLISVILPAMQVSAERTLTWTSNADFSHNKISDCTATVVSGVTITGAGYGDETCEDSGEDASVVLAGSMPVYLDDVKMVDGGDSHTLALKNDGTVWAWGNGGSGYLGVATQDSHRLPIQVRDSSNTGFLTDITAIAVGENHSLALKDDGTVWAWGSGQYGKLGDGTTSTRNLPVQVKDSTGTEILTGVAAIEAGGRHSLALMSDGTVWAWGDGGLLGDGSSSSQSLPVQVKNSAGTGVMAGVTALSAGRQFTIALKEDGTVWAWGNGTGGKLGNGEAVSATLPVQVKDLTGSGVLTDITSVSSGMEHSIALKGDGTVWAWGVGGSGRLGDGMTSNRPLPVQVRNSTDTNVLENIVAITAGGTSSFALSSDGTGWAWGANSQGHLGDGTSLFRHRPVQVRDPSGGGVLTDISVLSAGTMNTFALRNDGTVWAWGSNNHGQLGDGTAVSQPIPKRVISKISLNELSDIREVSTTYGGKNQTSHALALKNDGTVWAWGYGQYGKLGDGATADSQFPVQVKDSTGSAFLTNIVSVAASGSHSLALKNDGTVWAWGDSGGGALGEGTSTTATNSLPVQVKDSAGTAFLTDITAISAGNSHSLALKNDGTVWAWGSGSSGQLGDGDTANRNLPVQVKNSTDTGALGNVIAISGGGGYSLALKNDGTVWAWGSGLYGKLGNGTTTNQYLPTQVKDTSGDGFLTGVISIAAGGTNSLALKNDGTVWAWGRNFGGGLGDGTTTQRSLPVQTKAPSGNDYLTGIVSIAAGDSHSLAIKNDGTVWAWGSNTGSQLGHGAEGSVSRPTQVRDSTGVGFLTDAVSIAAGFALSLAIKEDGTVWAWGNQRYTGVGDGTVERRSLPVSVIGSGGYNPTGTISSLLVDVGTAQRTQWNNITWQTDPLPDQTSVSFALRTSHDGTNWSEWSEEYVQSETDSVSFSADISGLPMSRFAEVRMTLQTEYSSVTPQLNDFSLTFMSDTVAPAQNAADIQAAKGEGGVSVAEDAWSNVPPYFSWSAAEDNTNGSGIWGYCLYLGHDSSANVQSTKGLLGTSPIDSHGACEYLTASTSLNLAQHGVLSEEMASSNDNYYLSVKAIDNVGNLYDGNAETFGFKFDNTPPRNPSFISAPAGFVSNKNVLLTWPHEGDDGPFDATSGVAGLQYRIGADGTWYGDGHSGAQDITDLLTNNGSYRLHESFDYPSVKEGNNVIYFRTYDNAGNISATYSTAAVKINTTAPSTPQNVQATPSTNTLNSFAFSWQKPSTYVGNEAGLTYCYTINVLPAENTCVYTDATSLAADAYATQPGANTFYLVAKDESGSVNYDTYASVGFIANTAAPGVATSVEIADISTKATSAWKLAVSWESPVDTGAGVARYQIFRSANGGVFTQIATTAGKSYVDADLAQLEYTYRIKACDSANNCGAFSADVSALPTGRFTEPPELLSNPSVETSTRRASFYWVTDRNSDSRVQYGTESGVYLPGEITVSDSTKTHGVDIANLDAGTTYYYRVKWMDEDGNIGVSSEYSFKTLPAPVIKSVEVTKANLSSAIIRIVTRDATRVSLFYGKSENFGGVKSINTSLSESTYDIELAGLDDGSQYFFKIITTDSDGNTYDSNRIDNFNTPPRPRISNLQFQPVEGEPTSTQKVSWTTNVPTSSLVTYGPTGTQGTDSFKSQAATEHEIIISNLIDNTEYFLLAQGRDSDGNLAVSDRQTFRTALDTRPPKISNVRVETSVNGSGQTAHGQVIVYWKTDEPATSQVAYATGSNATSFTNFTSQDSRLTTDHIVIISNLSFSTIYSLQPVSEDESKNKTEAAVQSAIVGRPTESILDIISGALSRLFGL